MGFIDSYKNLEKICGEILNDNRRLSAYIDEMNRILNGSYHVNGWDDDLKQLKHYRWIRNQIVHQPDCTEENMCEPEDTQWLNNFYSRIMNQTDPLAMYAKATKPRTSAKPTQTYKPESVTYNYSQSNPKQTHKTESVTYGYPIHDSGQTHKAESVTYEYPRRKPRRRVSKKLRKKYIAYLVYLVCVLIIIGSVILFSKIN